MSQVGRISGPLLEANLLRLGQVRTSQENLAFRNDLNTTQLLYLDVQQGRIAINGSVPSHELHVTGTTRTKNLIVDIEADIDGRWNIQNSTLTLNVGDINLNANEAIVLSNLETSDFFASDNYITTKDNANLELVTNGTGTVEVLSDLLVDGNIYTPGNLTFEGSITFGDAQQVGNDTVDFNSDINSDIIPDQTDTYNLGSVDKRWSKLNTNLINGNTTTTANLITGANNYNLRAGNIFYVSENGDDTNTGDHPLAPFNSIKRACQAADASVQGPVIIHVFPGGYEEECPIVVPPNVTIVGHDMRNTIVRPESAYQSEDIFHLEGDTTIKNLTIKDFYYDSVNNTGYAFRYAPNAITTSRSPYIQDVTVITQGTTITADDPRGFASGDAGKGAWIDGAEMDPNSFDASMLFHSCTFITPGVDAITMTNGVRVEWLNSFTYFADRGLYAVNGATGRVTQDGSTVNYGAEVRSIGSANVYGNYGAVADGADTLMYLIQHNMAYIGVGKYADNDKSRIIQENEIVELNNGVIHYTTTDHTGSFRVGDNFFVDFETGSTTINIDSLTANALNGLVITTGAEDTKIDGAYIEVGNFNIVNNLIESVTGDINIAAATNEVNLNSNTSVSGNLDITGNLSFDGSLNLLGNQPTDTLKFNVNIDQDFNPHANLEFTLGTVQKEWTNTWLSSANIGDIRIFDNVVTTDVSNTDLELRANGSGRIFIPSNDVSITNALTVDGLTDLQSINITGTLNQTGNFSLQVPDFNIDGNLTVGQNLNVVANAQFEEILFANNVITTTTSNTDLELRASGTGRVVIPDANLTVTNNVEVIGSTFVGDVNNSQQVAANTFTNGDIELQQNYIQTTLSNSNLELRAPAGRIINITDSVTFNQNLTVNLDTTLQNTSITGSLLHTGNYNQTGNFSIAGEITNGNILIEDNFISTTNSNSDLELRSSGTGDIFVTSNNVQIDNNLTVNGSTLIDQANVTTIGTVIQTGDVLQTGNKEITGDVDIDGTFTTDRQTDFTNISIGGNLINTTSGNLDLDLRASGTGSVIFAEDVYFGQELSVRNVTVGNITIAQDLNLNDIVIPPSIIQIDDNFISTKISNEDLDLRANGTGIVLIPSNNTVIEQNLTINGNTNLKDTAITGNLTHTGDRTQTGNFTLTGNLSIGSFITDRLIEFDDIKISGNVVETTLSNSNLDLRANGTGKILFNDDVRVYNNLTTGTFNVNSINVNNDVSFEEIELSTDIQFEDNFITTTNSNSNLELRAAGTGSVYLEQLEFDNGSIATVANPDSSLTDIVLGANQNIITSSTSALQVPTGTSAQRVISTDTFVDGGGAITVGNILDGGNASTIFTSSDTIYNSGSSTLTSTGNLGDIRFHTTDNVFEGTSNSTVTFGGVYSSNRRTRLVAHPTNDTISMTVNNSLIGTVASTGITLHGLEVDDISFNQNVISTTVSNSDLELRANGTGDLILDDIILEANVIKNSGNNVIVKHSGFGHVKFNGTAGVVVPFGTTAEQPPVESPPQTGDTRWNTDTLVLETWDGNQYITAAGVATAITPQEFDDLLLEYTLIFG